MIKLIVDGKEYKDIKQGINDAFTKAKVEGVKELLKPYESEILKHNGQVTLTVKSDSVSIKIDGIPKDLEDKINFDLG